jgi:hypothetical protein
LKTSHLENNRLKMIKKENSQEIIASLFLRIKLRVLVFKAC